MEIEQEYGQEFAAFERAGLPGDPLIGVLYEQGVDKLDMFIINIDKVSRDINRQREGTISTQSIEFLVDTARKIPNIEFKNPTAYVLSYLITFGNREITQRRLDEMYELLQRLETKEDLVKVDLVRYSRFWSNVVPTF
jgi:hypothetical protein